MKYIFFGSPEFAATFLKSAIRSGMPPAAIVCNPDRPVGRKKTLTAPPVKMLAAERDVPVFQPESKAELSALSATLSSFSADIFVVAAYAHIIPSAILELAKKGVVGVHPSLLPKYRGATPIQSALLGGENKTGVTLYQMDAQVDHGPIIAQEELLISPTETYLSLEARLARLGAELFIQNAQKYAAGTLRPVAQDHNQATLTKKFSTKDAEVDFQNEDPQAIYRKIQALNPEPGVYTFSFPGYEGRRVKLLAAKYDGTHIQVTQIQPDGKKPFELTRNHKVA